MLKTIFFDFDDTLSPGPVKGYLPKEDLANFGITDAQYSLMQEFEKAEADNYFFFENSRDITTIDLEKEKQRGFYTAMAEFAGIERREDFLTYIIDYRIHQLTFSLYPEVETVIAELAQKYKMYFLTNAMPSREREMGETSISKYFEGGFISNIIGHGKPSKGIYEYALKATGNKPEECVFIDDKEAFVLPALEVGLQGVVMDRKNKYPNTNCNRVQNLVEFAELLKTL